MSAQISPMPRSRGELVCARCRRYVLDACARAVEDRDLVVSQPPWPLLRNKDTKFGSHIRRRHYTGVDCMMHVAHDYTLLEHINDHGCLGHQLGLDFTFLWVVSAHRGHKRSRPHVLKPKKGVREDVQVTIASLTNVPSRRSSMAVTSIPTSTAISAEKRREVWESMSQAKTCVRSSLCRNACN